MIGALRGVLVAPENPQALIEAMCLPSVKIVSLTVTEKGYCHDPATGELNEQHPDILHDLSHPDSPRSAPGFLVEAIARPQGARAAALHRAVLRQPSRQWPHRGQGGDAARRNCAARTLGRYVAENVAFPATMVDRIVPATTDADRARIAAATGLEDAWPVVTEAFTTG